MHKIAIHQISKVNSVPEGYFYRFIRYTAKYKRNQIYDPSLTLRCLFECKFDVPGLFVCLYGVSVCDPACLLGV